MKIKNILKMVLGLVFALILTPIDALLAIKENFFKISEGQPSSGTTSLWEDPNKARRTIISFSAIV